MALQARLDKSGLRVVCAVKDCGAELCWVLSPIVGARQVLWFLPGWTIREDGVWVLSRRAAQRVRRGRRPADRRLLHIRKPPNAAFQLGREPATGPMGLIPYRFPDRPLEAVCTACGFRQVLDLDVLNVSLPDGTGLSKVVRTDPRGIQWQLSTPEELGRWQAWHPPPIGAHGA